jgi:hypothetical protein
MLLWIIYQHEARGADAAITAAIDAHVESEQGKGSDDGGASGAVVHAGTGTLMARGRLRSFHEPGARDQREPLTWDFTLERVTERVTGIEPALSAWESDRSGPLTSLSWASGAPLVTVMNPVTPGLMAHQWPGVRSCRAWIGPGTPMTLCPAHCLRSLAAPLTGPPVPPSPASVDHKH